MKKISTAMVKQVASIARLNLSSKEVNRMQKDLSEILAAFKDLDKLNVKQTKPSFQPLPIINVFREDSQEQYLTQDKALSNTEHKEKGFFKGPRAV